jgi:Lar family restriction alleviation protein
VNTPEVPQLKPCPFCGGEAEIEKIGTARQSMIIVCTDCGCRVESGDVFNLTRPENYKWNRRVET